MAQPERFEILILGSGKGGKLLAWEMARSGRRTAVVESRYIGGSCPNINCLPSKNEIWSAKVAYLVRHAAQFGEVMAVVQTAMLAHLPYPKLRDAILAHPTMAEGLGSLFANVPPRAVRQITPKQTGLH
jgi:choline dehydrogenase-like flavoprotein